MHITLYQSGRALSPYISYQDDITRSNRLYYIFDGTGGVLIDGKQYPFEKGCLYIIPRTVNFIAYQNGLDPLEHLYFDFSVSPALPFSDLLELQIEEGGTISHMVNAIRSIAPRHKFGSSQYNALMKSALETLLLMIDKQHAILTPSNTRFDRVLQYIFTHYAEDISVSELAKMSHMEENYFIRIFKNQFRTTPYQYLREYRLNMAIEMLKSGESIAKTAENVGYNTATALSHALKKSRGFYPSEVQNRSHNTYVDDMVMTKHPKSKWIWLDNTLYPDYQQTYCTTFADKEIYHFCVAEFKKTFKFRKKPHKVRIYISGDTKFRLFVNDSFIGVGPVVPGGDYGNTLPMPKQYCNYYDLTISQIEAEIFVQIQLSPEVMTDYSCGHGGFWLALDVEYTDKTTESFGTDETWPARLNGAYLTASSVDFRILPEAWHNASLTENIWNLTLADIPMLAETTVFPQNDAEIIVCGGETVTRRMDFDKIYSAYICLDIQTESECTIELDIYETAATHVTHETVITKQSTVYRGLRLQSVGGCTVSVHNAGKESASVRVSLAFTCYPVTNEGTFTCSNPILNEIYSLGKWTLQICRQTLHLDSPFRQQTLGGAYCYLVENLISYFAYDDTRLIALDITRMADYLLLSDGFTFHTTCGLIWVQILYDYYMFTGNISLVKSSLMALHGLLRRMATYTNESGIITSPPNFMFIDWASAGEYNMHHPPKAIGQTCLNAFYYKALMVAERLCRLCNDDTAKTYAVRAEKVKKSFNLLFWNDELGLYCDGTTESDTASRWKPANPKAQYYSQHSNALAVLYDLCPPQRQSAVMERVLHDKNLTQAQPYFMHYILEALYKTGLFQKYGIPQIQRWESLLKECNKGMKEFWSEFKGDYSHAWSCTPTYQLPSKLLGFEMLEPGFKKILLRPNLYGLSHAEIKMPTPYGFITCKMREGKEPEITHPDKIIVEVFP